MTLPLDTNQLTYYAKTYTKHFAKQILLAQSEIFDYLLKYTMFQFL